MLFNSLEFIIFLTIFALALRFATQRYKLTLFLLASYFFYGFWEWKYLSLIIFSTVIDYFTAIKIEDSLHKNSKKKYLAISVLINLGTLAIFKYFNFFSQSLVDLLALFGFKGSAILIDVLLPVGISFYTFQSMSYSIDVYRGNRKASRSFLLFATYVSYFPQLVAGPIERSDRLMPQLINSQNVNFKTISSAIPLIVIGFFKKAVVADRLARYVDTVHLNLDSSNDLALLISIYFFSIQIYCDFSGYTDIARGISRLFGIELMENFNYPYFAKGIKDFWSRWHISLTTWFRDYLYIPLGGSQTGNFKKYRNIFIVFIISALWHGANWTFIIWGGLHFLYYLMEGFTEKLKFSLPQSIKVLITFHLVTFAWIYFRATDIESAHIIIQRVFNGVLINSTEIAASLKPFSSTSKALSKFFVAIEAIGLLAIIEYFNFKNLKLNFFSRNIELSYSFIIVLIILFGEFGKNNFIYFQF